MLWRFSKSTLDSTAASCPPLQPQTVVSKQKRREKERKKYAFLFGSRCISGSSHYPNITGTVPMPGSVGLLGVIGITGTVAMTGITGLPGIIGITGIHDSPCLQGGKGRECSRIRFQFSR